MARTNTSKFNIISEEDFFLALNPDNIPTQIGTYVTSGNDYFIGEFSSDSDKTKFGDEVNKDGNGMSTLLRQTPPYLTLKALHTCISYIFSSIYSSANGQNHSVHHLALFFHSINPMENGHIASHYQITNDFVQLILPYSKFKDHSITIKGNWECLIDEVSVPYETCKKYANFQNNKEEILIPTLSKKTSYEQSTTISGTKLINEAFFQKNKGNQSFSMFQFYTSKQNDDCQWYGIIKEYAIKRKDFTIIRNRLKEAFNVYRTFKVLTVISGSGGSGKSTLLRQLAIDLRNESFKVLWIEENEFKNFSLEGLEEIKSQSKTNYLLFIEDWYRLTDSYEVLAKELLVQSKTLNNIRIVIGDRIVKGKIYLKFLAGSNSIYKLTNTENKDIIDLIGEKNERLKSIIKSSFKNKKQYDSPLFLLLFTIARINEDYSKEFNLDLSEPETAFLNIIASDIKYLFSQNRGLAKMLCYTACLYTNYSILIPYKLFIDFAGQFGFQKDETHYMFNLNGDSAVHEKLRFYIHLSSDINSKSELVQFNHDIIAETGIYNISNLVDGIGEFDDSIKLEFLKTILSLKEYEEFSSGLLAEMLKKEPQLFHNDLDKHSYVIALLNRNNRNHRYLNSVSTLNIEQSAIIDFFKTLLKKELFPQSLWSYGLINHKEVRLMLLEQDEIFLKAPPSIVLLAHKRIKLDKCRQKLHLGLLKYESFYNLPTGLVSIALNSPRNKELREKQIVDILNHKKFKYLPSNTIWMAIKNTENKKLKEKKITELLNYSKIYKYSKSLVFGLFNLATDYRDTMVAASNILNFPYYSQLDEAVLSRAFITTNDKELRSRSAQKIFYDKKLLTYSPEIIRCGLAYCPDSDEKQKIISKILLSKDGLPHTIISRALKLCTNEELKNSKSIEYLKNWKAINLKLFFASLHRFKNKKLVPEFVNEIVAEIISDYHKDSGKNIKIKYFGLMRVPLHLIESWNLENKKNIANWELLPPTAKLSLIYANKEFPNNTKQMCQYLLHNWEKEVWKKILLTDRVNYGDHVRQSFEHPDLVDLAKEKALEMKQRYKNDKSLIPKYYVKIIDQILKS